MTSYQDFIKSKERGNTLHGFKPLWMPDWLFGFQGILADWSIRKGRAAIFADCGMGKTPLSLVWAENVLRKTNKSVMIFTPLAVAEQFVREGVKFGIEVNHARSGRIKKGINVVNYQRMHYFTPSDFAGVVCDESGCLKHHDTKTRKAVTEFVSHIPYCLLGTATPAPNDFMELGNSAEVLRIMKYAQMLGMFFVNDGETSSKWSLKGHAKSRFWQWVSTWARAVRKPSDLGFGDDGFILPELIMKQHLIPSPKPKYGFLPEIARTLEAQRKDRRETLVQRCEKVAELVPDDRPFLVWCHLNPEGDLLEKLIPDAVQVQGSDKDSYKEDKLNAFAIGNERILITKPKIGGWGLNLQRCSDMSFFPQHSYEAWYQSVRRCWRFGQENPVTVNIVTSEAESMVLSNMQRKERQADDMFSGIVREMSDFQMGKKSNGSPMEDMEVPSWL